MRPRTAQYSSYTSWRVRRVFPCHKLSAPAVDTGTNASNTIQFRAVQGSTTRSAVATTNAARRTPPGRRQASHSAASGRKYSTVSRVRTASPKSRPAPAAAVAEPRASLATSRSIAHHSSTVNSVSAQKCAANHTSSG